MFAFNQINLRPQSVLGRRQFLTTSTALTAAAATGGLQAAPNESTKAKGVFLTPASRDLFRTRIELEVKGNVDVPKNPLISRKSEVKLPIESNAVLDYEERFRRPQGAEKGSTVTMIERYYHEAKNRSVLNRKSHQCELRDSVRDTIVRRETLPEVVYAVDDYFQSEELELLSLPASSVAVDQLLPTQAVSVGSVYQPSNETMISVLNLTSAEANDVEAEVMEITEKIAKINLKGKVDGSVEGVPTVVRVIAKLVFDRVAGTCTWLAMAIHETREIGKAEPGFDVAATIKMIRRPLAKPIALPTQPPRLDITGPIPRDRMYVDLQSTQLGVSVLMDRSWRMMNDVPGAAMMRMIENDRSIAQCDFRPLVALAPGNQWTLEAFQDDVQRTLGEQLLEFVEADQRLSESGLRVLRVTARGEVQGIPIQWVVLHFSDDSGRRVLATFTMEGQHVEAFAGADIQMASSLSLTPLPAPSDSEVTRKGPSGESSDRVAKSNSGEDSDIEVQSASDLR